MVKSSRTEILTRPLTSSVRLGGDLGSSAGDADGAGRSPDGAGGPVG